MACGPHPATDSTTVTDVAGSYAKRNQATMITMITNSTVYLVLMSGYELVSSEVGLDAQAAGQI